MKKIIPRYFTNFNVFKLSILIPTVEECNKNKDLQIIPDDSTQSDWTELSKYKKILIKWLDEKNHVLKDTNIVIIRFQWNQLNSDNKNVKQIEKIF